MNNEINKEICRAFTLFHNKIFIHPSNIRTLEQKLIKEYLVIGYFDWFQTSLINITDRNNLNELFKYITEINKNGNGFQSFQNIFGFRDDSSSTTCSDNDFWNIKSEKLLNFILFLQVEKYDNNLVPKIEIILNQVFDSKQFIVYYTLDKNDFVICFKSNEYYTTINAINHLYHCLLNDGVYIVYSYTNLVIKYSLVNNRDTVLSFLTDEFKHPVENIQTICIKTILNYYNKEPRLIPVKINHFCNHLSKCLYGKDATEKKEKKEIVGYEIVGDYDCRFIAKNVPLDKIILLFSHNGLLSIINDNFRYCFLSSMTSIDVSYDNCSGYLTSKENKEYNEIEFISREELKKLEKKHTYESQSYIPLFTLLYQIYDYIDFIGHQTSKYEFYSLKRAYEVLINIIDKSFEEQRIGPNSFEELYEYLSSMYTSIQENMRTDIRFYGISDFSMMSYYSPTKLRSFYSMVVNEISSFYKSMCPQDKNLKYEYMIFFTYASNTFVDQLWKDFFDEDKLMMVKISEKDFYEIKDLIFQLAHEAAHFVGNDEIRNRRKRYNSIIDYLIYRVYKYTRNCIDSNIESLYTIEDSQNKSNAQSNDFMEIYTNVLRSFPFNEFLSKNKNRINNRTKIFVEESITDRKISEEKYFYYRSNVVRIIPDFLYRDNFLKKFINDYFNEIFEKVKLYSIANIQTYSLDSIKNFMSNIYNSKSSTGVFDETINQYVNEYISELLFNKDSDFNFILKLIYETYADLSAVFSLNLNVTDVFEVVFSRIEENEDYTSNILFQRMCIVTKVLVEKREEGSLFIDSSFYNFLNKMPHSWKKNHTLEQYEDIVLFCSKIDKLECKDNIGEHYFYTYKYLKECLDNYCDKHDTKKRFFLSSIYSKMKDNNIFSIVKYINGFVSGKTE